MRVTLRCVRRLIPVIVLVTACSPGLSPAPVAAEPGGTFAVSFSRAFPPGFWEPGDHAYRLVVECPSQRLAPPVVRFTVDPAAPSVGTSYLRFDGVSTTVLSPADLPGVNPSDATEAVVTLVGMSEVEADEARSGCSGTVIWDGLDPEPLDAGAVFSP